MKALFIEATQFTEWITDNLPDDTFARLQEKLLENPKVGKAMKGCGGLRKVRFADPKRGKGSRGGIRVIYLYVPEARWFYLLDIYDKDEQEDLSSDERKQLAQLAAEYKKEAKAAARRFRGEEL